MRLAAAVCLAILPICAQQIEVSSSKVWTDTGIDVRPGDSIAITADGTLQGMQGTSITPAGATRGFRDLLKSYPVNEAGLGALIGRIGSTDVAQAFVVGAKKELEIRRVGRLFLGVNYTSESLQGSYQVNVEFSKRGPEKIAA